MTERTIVTLVPRDTTPARPVGPAAEPVDVVAPVLPLRPATLRDDVVRLIEPVDAPAGRVLRDYRFTGNVVADPGPLARAMLAARAAEGG